jgi:uncharacterized protein YbbC (DUF1343 family)
LRDNYPERFVIHRERFNRLAGDERVYEALKGGEQLRDIVALWQQDLADFMHRRSEYLLY